MKCGIFLLILCVWNFHVSSSTASYQEAPSPVFEEYDRDFVELVEMIYGEGLLSQGGIHSIEEMFYGINLNGLKMLDLGCGLGIYDIHLAKHHNTQIVGIDPQEALIQKAKISLNKAKDNLVGSVSFSLMEDLYSLKQFADHSFDIVFSKEAVLHVPLQVKEAYFQEIYRVLKPGGKIVIMDWMHTSADYTGSTRKMMEMDDVPFQLVTPSEYRSILEKVGFAQIELTDTTFSHMEFSQQNIDTIVSIEDKIKTRFGEEMYNYSLESWGYQKDAFKNRELLTGVFKAYKN